MNTRPTATDGRAPPSHAGHRHMEHDAKQRSAESSAEPPTSTGHVAPPPPQHSMESMDARQMVDLMEMDDAATFAMLKFDRLERADTADGAAITWKFAAWAGGDFDKLLVRSEGERAQGALEPSDAEVLWSHAVAPYWDTELGVRNELRFRPEPQLGRTRHAGLAPYWFEVGATAYVGDAGHTALRLEIDYELSLTQRLILQPRFELNAYGKDEPAAYIGSGLSDTEFGLRLRYEIRRQFAPYIGIERSRGSGAARITCALRASMRTILIGLSACAFGTEGTHRNYFPVWSRSDRAARRRWCLVGCRCSASAR